VYHNNKPIIDEFIIMVTPCQLRATDSPALAGDKSRFGVAIEVKESTEGIFFRE
jgi:hypothetical protein